MPSVLVLLLVLVLGACSFKGEGHVDDASARADSDDVDPPPPDVDAPAAPFDLASCPGTYGQIIGAGSRYRIIDDQTMTFWQRHDDCLDDLPGRTHLAILEDADEASALQGAATGAALAMRYYVGVVQMRAQPEPSANWILLSGHGADATLWAMIGGAQEPDDNAPPENAEENVAVLTREVASGDGFLLDVDGTATYGAICECDGSGLAQSAIDAINDDPNHP